MHTLREKLFPDVCHSSKVKQRIHVKYSFAYASSYITSSTLYLIVASSVFLKTQDYIRNKCVMYGALDSAKFIRLPSRHQRLLCIGGIQPYANIQCRIDMINNHNHQSASNRYNWNIRSSHSSFNIILKYVCHAYHSIRIIQTHHYAKHSK